MINFKVMKHLLLFAAFALFCLTDGTAQDFYAHRAGRKENDENTLAAFKKCMSLGVDRFETDVRIARDGSLIISHDANLKRRTGYDGIIEKMTRKEIKAHKTTESNEIPTLKELLRVLRKGKASYVEFEMKTTEKQNGYTDEMIPIYCNKVYGMVISKQPKGTRWVFTSFDERPLRYLRAKDANVQLGYITGNPVNDETIAKALELGVNQIDAGVKGTTKEAVAKAHKAGLRVCLWPGNNIQDYLNMKELGADGMCTDVPEEVLRGISEDGESLD